MTSPIPQPSAAQPNTAGGVVASSITVGYGQRTIIRDLSATFPAGKITTIVGPNGCGKSTLLRAMSGLLNLATGNISVNGNNISDMKRKDVARILGVLPQSPVAPEGLLVSDLVARGRHPHQAWFRQWSATDEDAVYAALKQTGSADLANRTLDELSGGQRQRVWISMVLAQNTDILFLDEPTTYLDLATSVDILELVDSLRQKLGRTVVMVLHDLNLAVRYSDYLVVMKKGQVIASGTPGEVITAERLQQAFDLRARVIEDPETGDPLIVPLRKPA
ncbi:ATP-binding cassette domain-containing protein [Corynebacterium macginleyi]|uniref:ABC transporter ATP-binding protein n=1 Tax=Corynebacterium macginleyi TaxID=38290 RepID=A0A3M0GT75_9CORY|nr:ABC transporter ATP-binding protein [Corynebacterium macginleyi]MBK4140653.1 ATP-binding cassette domain-containing protein [Corynebacterium macginleyi]MBK4145161.1 ATP-binding cassette domain-containing protein [Corynebacterium macginleyi]MBK4152421.1 ATP-binding cassette domain-containing protein [Corynebacterium macginleyi]MBK4156075.1 ATP-binding cassette domain-containing protein [Corynebacterium macginleyi]MBK4160841.1 ATP-binding cassette domain-containing protein [Corynebacterium ma